MSLNGKFAWYTSLRSGGRKAITFTLTCDNLFQWETFDCAIIANNSSAPPMIFRQLKLKAKQSLQFNYDTIDWQWCNGDTFVILGKKDSIKKKWPLILQMYKPGECPECHGTGKCHKCNGKGYINLPNHNIEHCHICFGSGMCQTCYIPQRDFASINYQTPKEAGLQHGKSTKEKQIETIRRSIAELQHKIEQTQWDMRMMQIKDMDSKHSNVYLSYSHLLHSYNIEMINLQSKLEQLEQL